MNDNDTLEDITANVHCSTSPTEDKITSADKSAEKAQSSPTTTADIEIEVFDRIANKLLRSGLLLTALELHAELIERGKELPRLREFFDNPHNFEKQSENTSQNRQELNIQLAPNVVRSPSEQTFESFDFTHYSDDVERPGDERVAVLEFELRKAQQTINTLRASLTMSTTVQADHLDESDLLNAKSFNLLDGAIPSGTLVASLADSSSFSDRGSADGHSGPGEDDLKLLRRNLPSSADNSILNVFEVQESGSKPSIKYSLSSIKPHELRAINYLVNEYLLATNYKITSITFCDENADQDFDKWEDVGLNTDRPPDLLRLYRYFWQNCSSLLRTNSNATTIMSSGSTTVGTKAPTTNSMESLLKASEAPPCTTD